MSSNSRARAPASPRGLLPIAAPIVWALVGWIAYAPVASAEPSSSEVASPPRERAREQQAHALFESGRYVESARIFEDLWTSSGRSEFLYYAALSRQSAGDHAHAAAHLERYVAEVDGAERERARANLARSEGYTTPVRLTVTPAAAREGGRVTLTRRDALRVDGPFEYPLALRGDVIALELEHGEWTIEYAAEGFRGVTEQLTIKPDQTGPVTRALSLVGEPIAVSVVLGPDEALASGLYVRVRSGPGVQAPYREQVDGAVFTRRLRQGTWELVFEARGYKSQARTLELGPRPVELNVTLEPDEEERAGPPASASAPRPRFELRPPTRVVLGGALGGLGGVLIASGVGFAIGGHLRLEGAYTRESEALQVAGVASGQALQPGVSYKQSVALDAIEQSYPRLRYHADLCAGIGYQAAGAGLIGGGFGLALGAVAARLDAPEPAWWAGAGLGLAATATGAIWLAVITPRWRSYQTVPDPNTDAYSVLRPGAELVTPHRNAQVALATVTGAGVGLLLGSAVGLATGRARGRGRRGQRAQRSLQPSVMLPGAGGHAAGLQLRGAF